MRIITDSLIKNFETHLVEEEKSKNTTQKYIRDVTFFMNWLHGREVTKLIALEYKKELLETYAPASVNSIIASLNSFLAFMEWHEIKIKALKIQKQVFIDNKKELTKEEYRKLLEVANKKNKIRLYLLMKTVCMTGIRVSELQYITTDALLQRKAIVKCKNKIRVIIIPDMLAKILLEYTEKRTYQSEFVFATKSGKSLDRSNIWVDMKKLCEEAGVEPDKVFPHNLRHLFARIYYSVEKDIVRLADILGHTNVNTTRIYTIESGEIHRMQMQTVADLLY